MRIGKAYFLEPGRNDLYGIAALTVSVFVFAYSTLFGPIAILGYYACWLPLVLIDYRRALGNYMRYWWILPFAILACLSVFWSLAPSTTLRAAVQYATHIVCALLAARVVTDRALTLGLLYGVLVVLVYSFLFGGYHYDPIDGTYSFVGAFASKNQLGFFASLGVFAAYVCVFVVPSSVVSKLLSALVGALSAYALVASQSATSIIGIVLTLAVMAATGAMLALSPKIRSVGFAFVVALALGLVFVGLNAGAVDWVLAAFGKDATLTGRTYLWSEGLYAFSQLPVLGTGYQAYWVQGFSEAERLWAEFYIPTRSGFHFHNTYIETLVELGGVGFLLLVALMLTTTVGLLMRVLGRDYDRTAYILFSLTVLLLIRSFVEVDTLYPYAIGSFLIYFAAGKLAAPRAIPAPAPEPAAGPLLPGTVQGQAAVLPRL